MMVVLATVVAQVVAENNGDKKYNIDAAGAVDIISDSDTTKVTLK